MPEVREIEGMTVFADGEKYRYFVLYRGREVEELVSMPVEFVEGRFSEGMDGSGSGKI